MPIVWPGNCPRIWTFSRRLPVVARGVGANPMEGHESLWDVFVGWHADFEPVLREKDAKQLEYVRIQSEVRERQEVRQFCQNMRPSCRLAGHVRQEQRSSTLSENASRVASSGSEMQVRSLICLQFARMYFLCWLGG